MKEMCDARREAGLGSGWIGVDLDGTLAIYERWEGPDVIGAPIAPMVSRVKVWLAEGHEVRIFTARVSEDPEGRARAAIEQWCMRYLGRQLRVTCIKDYEMIELWDDRAIQVIPNTGISVADELASERLARSGKP